MIEFGPRSSGWKAQCEDCPHVVEPDYGSLVYPHEEFPDTDDGRALADTWALRHRRRLPGHTPTVTLIHRDLDDLRDTIYWARNVAYSELGIETGGEQLAITSKWRPVGDPTRTFPPPPGARMPADWLYPPPAGWYDVGKLGHCRAWGPGWNGLSETRAAQLVGVDRQASDIHALGEDRRPREDLPLPDELRPRRNGSLLMDPADQIEAVLAVLAAAIPGASWTYVNGGTWTITLAGKESR